MAKRVLFQKLRLTYFGAKMAGRAAIFEDEHPDVAAAYKYLSDLTKSAISHCRHGKQDQFLAELDQIEMRQAKNELDAMLDGKSDELPEWLKK